MEVRSDTVKSAGIGKVSSPFYEPPPRKTSAEIINEARLAIRDSQMVDSSFAPTTIKPLQTQRPFTPRNNERLLFGKKAKSNRPPSSFSLRYLQNQNEAETLSSTVQTTNMALAPEMVSNLRNNNRPPRTAISHYRSSSIAEINDNKIFNIGLNEMTGSKIRLPSLETFKSMQKKKMYNSALSLDNLPEETEYNVPENQPESRKVFSSPQERTEYSDQKKTSPFGRPSKQQDLSQCLLLGPQNLNKLFGNKHIIEHSETLFSKTGYFPMEAAKYHGNYQLDNSSVSATRSASNRKTVETVLNELNKESVKKDNDETVIGLLSDLYDCMEKEDMLNNKASSKMKIQILKCLYKYVESQNDQLLISIARIILALKVTGNNLSGVCKLVFKVCKNDKNDHFFFQKNILELFLDALGRSSPLDDAEACVYGYGAVKFLTMNTKLLDKILSLGILPLMVLHIKLINNAKADKITMPEQTSHVLFQLSGALRNLVSVERIYEELISCGTVEQLCQTMELFTNDIDIINNLCRILSTISTNDSCCDSLAEHKDIYRLFILLFDKYPANEDIIVRLAYTLGNVVSKIDNTRVKYYREQKSIESVLNLWRIYLERTLKNCSMNVGLDGECSGNTEDVMIKLIRVIANIVINPEIGKAVNEKYGNKLIEEFLKVLISNPFKKNDELVLSILSTLNNLSYYYTSDLEHDVFHIKQIDIIEGIAEYTKTWNKECVIESMRILGNLSRSKVTRTFVTESDIFDTLLGLLDKVDIMVLKTTIGVFVNLMADHKSRMLLKTKGGVIKLINILKNYCTRDWLLGMLVCQVLWNFCIDTIDLYELFTENEIQELLVVLADYVDEEKLFGITEHSEEFEICVTQEYLIWEEFANVATNLLEKIEYFLDTFDQIQIEADEKTNKTSDASTNISFAAW